MFDRPCSGGARVTCAVSQERLSRRRDARGGQVVRARRSARARFLAFFRFFVERNALSRSFWLLEENAGVRTASARARRGDAPIGSSGPSRPRRSVADSARAPAAPQTRTSRTTPRESASPGRPWRSVRPSLSAALKKFPGNHVGEKVERSARRERIPRPARAPRPDARTCAHRRTRSPSRSEWARGKRSFVARLGVPRASLVGDASNTRLDAALCSRSARAKMERVDSLATSFAVCTQIISLKKN